MNEAETRAELIDPALKERRLGRDSGFPGAPRTNYTWPP